MSKPQSPEHTALPWKMRSETVGNLPRVVRIHIEGPTDCGRGYVPICTVPGGFINMKQDAAFIVEACNNYAALQSRVEELEKVLTAFVSTIENTGGIAAIEEGDGVAADPEWIDLRDAYEKAKSALSTVQKKG